MPFDNSYDKPEPHRDDVDAWPGATVLEFGQSWCGYCQNAQPIIAAALADYPQVKHVKVADGQGRPLGRSFRVKLWPTLVVLRDGVEVARVVRPMDEHEIRTALDALAAP